MSLFIDLELKNTRESLKRIQKREFKREYRIGIFLVKYSYAHQQRYIYFLSLFYNT